MAHLCWFCFVHKVDVSTERVSEDCLSLVRGQVLFNVVMHIKILPSLPCNVSGIFIIDVEGIIINQVIRA